MEDNVQEMQDLYAKWVDLLPELKKGLEQWKEATEIIERLQRFYFDPKWMELHDTFDKSALDTKGNYSVLSEDAVWNACHDQRQLSIQWLKQIVLTLDSET